MKKKKKKKKEEEGNEPPIPRARPRDRQTSSHYFSISSRTKKLQI